MPPYRCTDWRALDAKDARALIGAEAAVWNRDLLWNVDSSWQAIEPARAAGRLPGIIARDADGAVVGWSWFLRHNDQLQVGSFVSESATAARCLVEAILDSDAGRNAESTVWSVRGCPSGVRDALAEHDLDSTDYLYLAAPLPIGADRTSLPGSRDWRPADIVRVAQLWEAAYRGDSSVRGFAVNGTHTEWREYLLGLLGTDGCGRFLPEISRVVDDGPGGVAAAIMVTSIGTDVAHIPQIVVHPDAQGRGLGRRLLRAAMADCAQSGFTTMTLLVSESNVRARAMYEAEGFRERASFLVAAGQPRRLSSPALATGGASTRR